MKAVFVVLAAIAAVAVAQETCPCIITEGRDCPTIQLITAPNTCQTQVLPCEPCFCVEEGATATCPTDTVQAYQYTQAPLCELTDITVARCPDVVATPTPTPAPGNIPFQCIFDDQIPETNFTCTIPADLLPEGQTIQAITLDLVQSYDVTVFAFCGEQLGVGSLTFSIKHFVTTEAWIPNDPNDPPFGMGRTMPDSDDSVAIEASDNCQGTGDELSQVETFTDNFVTSPTAASLTNPNATPAFVAEMNANAGLVDTEVRFTFSVDTGVTGTLVGSGLTSAFTRIVFNFTFIY